MHDPAFTGSGAYALKSVIQVTHLVLSREHSLHPTAQGGSVPEGPVACELTVCYSNANDKSPNKELKK